MPAAGRVPHGPGPQPLQRLLAAAGASALVVASAAVVVVLAAEGLAAGGLLIAGSRCVSKVAGLQVRLAN